MNTQQPHDDPKTFDTEVILGMVLCELKKFEEAEPRLVEGYRGIKEREATLPADSKTRLTEALERIVQLYDAWGKPDQAENWRAKLPATTIPPDKPRQE